MTVSIEGAAAHDTATLGAFVEAAFATARVSDGHERDLLEQVRADSRYVPELELVVMEHGEIIGYAMASRTTIAEAVGEGSVGEGSVGRTWQALYLGPICTREDRRDAGLGSILVRELLMRGARLGYGSMFLAGDLAYYPRFGFRPASTWGIRCQFDIPAEMLDNIMGIEMIPGALDGVSGVVGF
jgi:putative acetyltransferase